MEALEWLRQIEATTRTSYTRARELVEAFEETGLESSLPTESVVGGRTPLPIPTVPFTPCCFEREKSNPVVSRETQRERIYEVIAMLDIKRIKEDPEKVKAGLRAKEVNCDQEVDRILALDKERRDIIFATEQMKAEQNKVSKTIPPAEEGRGGHRACLPAHGGAEKPDCGQR